jgi:hypothetical protein
MMLVTKKFATQRSQYLLQDILLGPKYIVPVPI